MRNLNLKSLLGFWYLVVLGLASAAWSQPAAGVIASKPPFAREWWLRTDGEERSGFLNGIADCLTWNAHRRGFSETPSQVMDKIDRFYKSHPESASLDVIDVWQKVTAAPDTGNYAGGQGEIWKNAHWYLNGDWWVQSSEAEQLGFVEGYLWCMRTQVPASTDSYSGSASSYRRKIEAFVSANPKQGQEAVADILHRYRDQAHQAAPK